MLRPLSRVLSLFLLAILIGGVSAPASLQAEDSQKIEAQGVAFMQAADPAIARDQAIADGLRKAVEQAVGTMISSETVVQNFQLLSDKIYNQTQGYIRNYRVTKEWQEEKLFYVTVYVEVAAGDLKNDLMALKLLQMRMHKPRMMVIVDENNVGQVAQWLTSTNMGIAEMEVTRKFQEKDFKMVDKAQAQKVADASQVKLAVGGDATAAAAIAAQVQAEVVLVGSAVSQEAGNIAGSSVKSIQAEVTFKAVKTDNAEIIATSSAHAAKPHISPLSGGTAAIKEAAGKAADSLMADIIKKWQSEITNSTSVQVMVSHIDYDMLNKFKQVLQEQVRGIKSVNQRSFTKDVVVLDVDVEGDAQYLADKIVNTPFPGFSLKVAAVSQNRLDLQVESGGKTTPAATNNDGAENEPNDDLWHANPIFFDKPVMGMVGVAGESDCYVIETDSREGDLRVKVEPKGPTVLTYVVEIFDGDRNLATSKAASQAGGGVTLVFKAEKLFDKYFIKISAKEKDKADTQYAYILKLNKM